MTSAGADADPEKVLAKVGPDFSWPTHEELAIPLTHDPTVTELLITGARLPDGRIGPLACAGGRFVEPNALRAPRIVDRSGYCVLPRLTDAHVHLDKSLEGGGWHPHRPVGSIEERVAHEIEVLDDPTLPPLALRSQWLLNRLVAQGSTRVRSHVDVGPGTGMRRLEAVRTAVAALGGVVDVDLVAFPQEGLLTHPGTPRLLDEVLSAGVHAVGGLDPHTVDGDREVSLEIVFDLAHHHRARVDIHLHEPGPIGAASIDAIVRHTDRRDLGGRVAVSHGYCLGQVPVPEARRLARIMAASGVALVSAVPTRGLALPYEDLLAAGVNLVLGSDNIRDCWSPFGTGDVLERVQLAAFGHGWYTDDEIMRGLELVTTAPAALLGVDPPGLEVGAPADFTLVRDDAVAGAVLRRPGDRIVVRSGAVVATNGQVLRRPDPTWGGVTPRRPLP